MSQERRPERTQSIAPSAGLLALHALKPGSRLAGRYLIVERLGPGEVNRPRRWQELTDGQRAFQSVKMAIHAAMIDRMDREIGRVLDQLRAMDAFENTLVFFLSDNGASAEIMVRDDGHDPSAEPGSAPRGSWARPGTMETSPSGLSSGLRFSVSSSLARASLRRHL